MKVFVDQLKVYLPALLLVVAGFFLAYQFVDPAPPKQLNFSAGAQGGAYFAYVEKYRDYLEHAGVSLKAMPSAGSQQNLARLKDGEADVAFVQAGMATSPAGGRGLESLGSLYYEPLWVFCRKGLTLRTLGDLKGRDVAIGPDGSGTRALALQLLHDNGLDGDNTVLLDESGLHAAEALRRGRLDAVFMVTGADSSLVKQLLAAEGVSLMSFSRAEGYVHRHRYLTALKLPQGVIDMQRNIPAADTTLLATTATLVVRDGLHPALQGLLMQAAMAIHRKAGLFETRGEFPRPVDSGLPMSKEAERYYTYGPPLLQRVLPFWAATLFDRLKVMLLPLIALLLPLFKVMPPLYRWRIRSRIYRWYRELGGIDRTLYEKGFAPEAAQASLAELDRLESEISKISVPLSYAEELYDLRMHLAMIRNLATTPRSDPAAEEGEAE